MRLFQKLPADQQKIGQALQKLVKEIDALHAFVIHVGPGPNPVPTFAIFDCGCVSDYKKFAADLLVIKDKLGSWLKR